MKRITIALALCIIATAAHADPRVKGTASGINTNCGAGCPPPSAFSGTVCVDPASKAADGSWLAITPSWAAYLGHRVVTETTVQKGLTIKCWKLAPGQ